MIEDFIDGETKIIKRCRKIIIDITITISLDLHSDFTRKSFDLEHDFNICLENEFKNDLGK